MKGALVLLFPGVEEIEAVTPIDLLHRAGLPVQTVSTGEIRTVVGRSGITLTAENHLDEVYDLLFDLVVIPGGPGIADLREENKVRRLIAAHDEAGKWLAAICAAPLLLKDAGILRQRSYTAHFTTSEELPHSLKQPVVVSENLITSAGAGTALPFARTVVRQVSGTEVEAQVAKAIMADWE
ncbi:MAG: DJ-1 family glyoxalase III [Puniceicoccaceae bacterium]